MRLLLAFLLALPLAAQVSVTITGPAAARLGATVTASLDLSGPVAAVQFETPLGTIVSIDPNAVAAGKSIQCEDNPGSRRCVIYGINTGLITGPAAGLVFPGVTELGPTTLLTTGAIASNPSAVLEPVNVVGLTITIVPRCDINIDGVIDAVDAQIALDQVLGRAPCASGDIVADGQCNVADVQALANVIVDGAACPAAAPISAP